MAPRRLFPKGGAPRKAMAEDVRGYAASLVTVDNAGTGRLCAEELRSRLRQDRMGSSRVWCKGYGPVPAR